MQNFHDNFTNRNGDAIAGVGLRVSQLGVDAALYSDNGTTRIPNPVYSDSLGEVSFYAANGTYQLSLVGALSATTKESPITLFDPTDVDPDNTADAATAYTGAERVGVKQGGAWRRISLTNLAAWLINTVTTWIQAGTGAVHMALLDKLRLTVDAADYGIVPGAVTNNYTAMVAAIVAARGKRIRFAKGNYLFASDSGSITLEEVSLIGEDVLDGANASIDQGVNFYITGTTNSPFKVRRGTNIKGIGFYYPNQPDSATPTAYPPVFTFDFTNGAVQFVRISNNVVFNAYRLCDIDNGSNGGVGHVEITDNYVCALDRGIYLRHNAECLRIQRNNFTFGLWLAATEAGAAGYMRANCTNIEIAQSDGVEIQDNLFYGSLNGVKLAGTALCQFMLISENKFDSVRFPIKATGVGNFGGVILGNTFNAINGQNTALQGRSISIDTSGGERESIVITGNMFQEATDDHVYVAGDLTTRNLSIGPNNYLSWAAFKVAGAYAALNISGGQTSANVTGGWFEGANASAYSNGIMGTLNTLQVTGATFDGCLAAMSVTANSVVHSGNVSFATGGATSDVISATTNWSTGNKYDKPSGATTKPSFHVRKAASQTFTNSGIPADVVWGTEVYDKGGNFATPTFTAPIAGRYRFEFALMHDNTGTAGERWAITLLGSASGSFQWSYKMVADYNSLCYAATGQLVAGETVKLQVALVAGVGHMVTYNDSNSNYFTGTLLEA